ncbi:MAG TPA: VCBS repeat-containing protein, partial [Puia sp.]|nr:VCBS repeat-containing protein [Puia sp.]
MKVSCLLMRFFAGIYFLCISFYGQAQVNAPLFKLLPPSSTGVNFKNIITENDTTNILRQANIYNGGGVGIGDFNRDGLPDIYFAGNMVSNKLFLNKGSLKFEDITAAAGVGGEGRWCTGVSVVDLNGDGWPDIYVSASFRPDALRRTNLLYINQGLNKEGVPFFKEMAVAYGIADTGFSTQGVFFDYDHDGDLDLYLVTNELNDPKTPNKFRPKVTDGSARNNDRLYRNNGNGTFTNVSREAGIQIEGWGHAVCISDFNKDGWPDIYVANDFVSNDLLYINNKDGTFTNRLGEYFKHTGWNAMGTDAVDINNDGLVDLISLEMLPEGNLRKKRMLSGNEYYNYTNSQKYGYEHQYVRNVLQINSGMTPGGHPVFSDVAFMSGVYQTDWSWCPLVADFDNDGWRDLIITNGLPRDVTDLDYISYDNGQGGGAANLSLAMTDSLPIVKIANYSFRNTGGFLFENSSVAWGFTQLSFSNGAAYVDLDNDGDLDVVMNNINGDAFIYENTLNTPGHRSPQHTLSVSFSGAGLNTDGIGATVHIFYDGKQQYYEHHPCRGYLSTDDARAHFGLGDVAQIDSLVVEWPDGRHQTLSPVRTDQPITLSYKDAAPQHADGAQQAATPQHPAIPQHAVGTSAPSSTPTERMSSTLFSNVTAQHGIRYRPQERDFVDYNIQPTLPHKLSQYGPGIAVGDIDNNGFEDFYIGGTSGNPGVFFMQDAKGQFTLDSTRFLEKENRLVEDMGALLIDVNGDKNLDLYIVSGSYEIPPGHAVSQDRLYINDGKGRFTRSPDALPKETSNGSCVRAADFDGDGLPDLFVGGRVVSGAYPSAPGSFLLRNEGGRFVDVTQQYCPELQHIGMVTDALWSDFDNDGKVDLVLVGEWMPVTFLKNTGKGFVNVTETSGIGGHIGWYNSLVAGDFNNDGLIDYIAGNQGLNSNYKATFEEPMTILAKDLDQNGSLDAMVFCYMKAEDGTMKPFPMSTKDDMIGQLISIRKKYPTYKSYGLATLDDLWSARDRNGAIMLKATDMNTSYIQNKGNGKFTIKPLPAEAQTAPVYGMKCEDLDGDGNPDLLMVGNDFGMEPYSGRHDAFNGLCLKGDGKGNFAPLTTAASGFFVKGDAKGLATIWSAKDEELLLATQNQDSLLVFGRTGASPGWIALHPDDFRADVFYPGNRHRYLEFYYGSTYLSQSSRKIPIDKDAQKIVITNFRGQQR